MSPKVSPAQRTPEGFLLVDAYTARDGTLEYSDGASSWVEYRPRSELVKAAATFEGKPVTDEHPKTMVSAETWSEVSKGVHMGVPTVEVVDGVGYMRAKLLITDAALIQKIDAAGLRELSIGFTSVVVPTENGLSPDGVPSAAVQTDLQGNHVAVVKAGRAGPQVRLLMDGKDVPVHKEIVMEEPKNDAAGNPVEEVPVIGPDGQEVMLPTWAAAALSELQALKSEAPAEEAPAEAPAEELAPPPAAEEPPAPAAALAPAEEPPAAAPAEAQAPEAPPEEEEEEKKLKDASVEELEQALAAKKSANSAEDKQDSVRDLARRRAKLERLAAQAGVAEAVLDAEDAELARAFIAAKLPFARLDGMSEEQINAVVAVAASAPEKAAKSGSPGPHQVVQAPRADSNDSLIEAELRFLKQQGY